MNSERIREIQETTGLPNSVSVKQALLQVWNECAQEQSQMYSEQEVLELLLKLPYQVSDNIKEWFEYNKK